jgi:retron-type reverse transcriptase
MWFRPNRRAQDAIARIHFLASHSHEWVLEADIQARFDQIGHTPLLDRMRRRIKDKQILGLGKAFPEIGGDEHLRGSRGNADRHPARRRLGVLRLSGRALDPPPNQ